MICIIVLGYLLPAFLMWLYMRLSHQKGGKDYGSNIDVENLLIVLFPFINLLACLVWIIRFPRKINYNRFFGLK